MFFYYEQAKINLAEIFKKKIILLLFFSFYIIIWVVKRIYPSKNFFYIITPYLIIYTPLEPPGSSPVGWFSLFLERFPDVKSAGSPLEYIKPFSQNRGCSTNHSVPQPRSYTSFHSFTCIPAASSSLHSFIHV